MKRYHIVVKFDKEKIANIDFCKLHLIFTKHFKQRACLKRIPKPYKALLKRGKIFEYCTDDNENLLKFVIRCKYNENCDVCYVLTPTGRVITGWWQDTNDSHSTLKINLYER